MVKKNALSNSFQNLCHIWPGDLKAVPFYEMRAAWLPELFRTFILHFQHKSGKH